VGIAYVNTTGAPSALKDAPDFVLLTAEAGVAHFLVATRVPETNFSALHMVGGSAVATANATNPLSVALTSVQLTAVGVAAR